MNYNEYDNNGNRKGFDISEIINDKQKRSRFILFVYLIIFIILVVFIRTNVNNNQTQEKENKEETNNETSITDQKTNSELDEMFSFIDMNNYNFDFNIKIDSSNSIITGKRFNNKFSFELKNNEDVLYFYGNNNSIKAKDIYGEEKNTGFPYVLVNYFDTKTLKELINNSVVENDVYKITNEKIGKIVNEHIAGGDLTNTIEVIKSNNKIVQINLIISNAISSYTNAPSEAIISLKYSNFGLVNDFEIE